MMKNSDTVIARFESHGLAEKAIKHLSVEGFDIKNLSIAGKGYRTDEQVVGFFNIGDRIKFSGTNGVFWGSLWGLLAGAALVSIGIPKNSIINYESAIRADSFSSWRMAQTRNWRMQKQSWKSLILAASYFTTLRPPIWRHEIPELG